MVEEITTALSRFKWLFVKLELRAITNNHLNRESAVVISSTMPSAKYSCSRSPEGLGLLRPSGGRRKKNLV
jgi:hypothetical protein